MPRILVTGSNGYIGTALVRHFLDIKKYSKNSIITVDNLNREKWVRECCGCSLTEYQTLRPTRIMDLERPDKVRRILKKFKPHFIIHLASQPSGPFSEISPDHRTATQTGNIKMLSALIYQAADLGQRPKFIVTTTTGIAGAPEGEIPEAPVIIAAGSSYYVSRGFDSANMALAAKQLKFDFLELRTSIVYGTRISGLDKPVTRFDWDFWFGTAVNRFALRKRMNQPAIIYGQGLQKKPIIHLADVIASISNSVEDETWQGHEIMNQTTECLSVIEMAQTLKCHLLHIENPRIENESHAMKIENSGFLKLLGRPPEILLQSADEITADIDISRVPQNWKDIYAGKKI